jgi:hypothetical protein
MRLSEWRTRAPHKDSMTPKVLAVIDPVLASLGAEPDPSAWIVWGEDPGVRYVMLVPSESGLLQVLVRVSAPGEGPRASAKVIRWGRVQLGELGLEMVGGHRLLGFQVESHILRGTDDEGDALASFALEVFARIDGRPFTPRVVKRGRTAKAARSAAVAKPAASKPAATARKPDGAATKLDGAARKGAAASRKSAAGRSSS